MTDFIEFPKMARWSRSIIVTEKIDGTNGQIHIRPVEDGSSFEDGIDTIISIDDVPHYIRAGSRNRWLGHGKQLDNFGFAAWVTKNCNDLASLGAGRHFGEWWGAGIQRCYGLEERRFSLFNVSRWYDRYVNPEFDAVSHSELAPAPRCCRVVPVLISGPNEQRAIDFALAKLRDEGSVAAPGFMKPEGIIVWHSAANIGFKKTIDNDESPKSLIARSKDVAHAS